MVDKAVLALQESIALATHWLADEGWDVPQSYGEAFIEGQAQVPGILVGVLGSRTRPSPAAAVRG